MTVHDVAVVGLGAMGAAATYALARRGQRVIGVERFEPGHDRGSSHGESRIIRLAYFEDPAYVPLARLAYDAWRRLEADTGERVLTVTGILEAGVPGSDLVRRALGSAVEHGIAHEVLSAGAVNTRFGAFALPSGWDALYQPDGGVLQPEKAIRLQLKAAEAHGAALRTHTVVRRIEPTGDQLRIELDTGEVLEAGSAIIAAGRWIGQLVPDLDPHLTLTRQGLNWFDPAEPSLVKPGRMPVFLLDTGDDVVYGIPDLGSGVKAASHRPGAVLSDADAPRGPVSQTESEAIARALRLYVPAAAGPVLRTGACIYTRTRDEHFIVGPHPRWPRLVLASPCSGHGFKFASLLGDVLADLATTGATSAPVDLFQPGRFLG
jgi:sarcosine oxidase